MDKYYCPYCNPKFQFNRLDLKGNQFCGLCGEYLIKKSKYGIKQIVSLIIVFAFIVPIVYLFVIVINSQRKEKMNYPTITLLKRDNLKINFLL